ncbi:MAG TPA: class I SAM-dependent methyltransferase [bacterium]|nr:class I SAM-dependent methyltransferase [bacterium]
MIRSWWHIQSAFYRFLRRLPGPAFCLEQERRCLRNLLDQAEFKEGLVLDIGTGSGSTLNLLAKAPQIIALDRCEAMLRRIRVQGILRIAGDAGALPLAANLFSFVSVIGVTEYMPDLQPVIAEIRRVSRPGAFLLITRSPPCLLNRLRIVLGHRLFLRKKEVFISALNACGFEYREQTRSLIQEQCLFRLTPSHDDSDRSRSGREGS